jgi:hypothetical protein
MGKPIFRVIGDVHGHYNAYVNIAKQAENSLQIGDLGFEYDCLKQLDPEHHKVLAGNHDNYDKWGTEKFIHMQTGHWLGDYGVYTVPGFGDIFFVRGGYSIDWRYRMPGRSWWKDEELTYEEMQKALELYNQVKPEYVFTHECPGEIIDAAFGQKTWDGELLKPSMTAKLLDTMWGNHAPKYWLFGHHHKTWTAELRGTIFRCLPELGFVDFDKDREIVYAESPGGKALAKLQSQEWD